MYVSYIYNQFYMKRLLHSTANTVSKPLGYYQQVAIQLY